VLDWFGGKPEFVDSHQKHVVEAQNQQLIGDDYD
jgi:hypothetical protein